MRTKLVTTHYFVKRMAGRKPDPGRRGTLLASGTRSLEVLTVWIAALADRASTAAVRIRMIVDRNLRNLGLGKGMVVAAARAGRISSQGDTV
jgi:hypothetical protein